jgi:hypothetical protein
MTTVIERNEGHYKMHKLPYGTDYVWCPRCALVECDCGEMLVLSASLTTCGCGADHAALVREELASTRSSEGVSHPLDPWKTSTVNGATSKTNSCTQSLTTGPSGGSPSSEGERRPQKSFWRSDTLPTWSGVLCAPTGLLISTFRLIRGASRTWYRGIRIINSFCGFSPRE